MSDSALPPADLDLRLVQYFTVVAAHLHFGRAAVELRIAQPSLSRQIRQLETQVGARLLDRSRRGTRLTEAGEAFSPTPGGTPGPSPSPLPSPPSACCGAPAVPAPPTSPP